MSKIFYSLSFLIVIGFSAKAHDNIIIRNDETVKTNVVQFDEKEVYFQEYAKDLESIRKPFFSLRLHSGYGYITANSNAALNKMVSYGYDLAAAKDYYNRFRNTLLTGASFHFTPFQYKYYALGLGLTYINQTSSSSITGWVDPSDGVHLQYGTYTETIYTNLYAFSIRHNLFLDKQKQITLYEESGMGLLTYRNEHQFIYTPLLLKAFSPGYYTKAGVEVDLLKWLSFDINAGFFWSFFNHFSVDNGYSVQQNSLPTGQYESLAKVTIEAGLSFKF